MSNPFEIVNNILHGKEKLEDLQEFVPYITNRALSYHYDCIMQSNEMNMRSGLDKNMQYDFLFNSIRKQKRPFRKWEKKSKEDELILLIKEYYGVSLNKAREIISVLTQENFTKIQQKMQKGGIAK
jgi:hypothetical protein